MGKLHHLNVGCADASVIKTSSATFLIDCHNIEDHSHLLPSNKISVASSSHTNMKTTTQDSIISKTRVTPLTA